MKFCIHDGYKAGASAQRGRMGNYECPGMGTALGWGKKITEEGARMGMTRKSRKRKPRTAGLTVCGGEWNILFRMSTKTLNLHPDYMLYSASLLPMT